MECSIPEVRGISHHLCDANGAAFFLSCLRQRAAEVEVTIEEQRFPQSIFFRKHFGEALRDLDTRCGLPLWLCDENLVSTMDLDEFGLAELLSCSEDKQKCFPGLGPIGPPTPCALWFATAGASSCWRSDPLCWSTKIFVILGTATVQLQRTAPSAAVPRGLGGVAVAPATVPCSDLLTIPAGHLLAIPPGWWYALGCSEKLLAVQAQSLQKEDAASALSKLMPSLGQRVRLEEEGSVAAAQQQVKPGRFRRCLRGLFSLPSTGPSDFNLFETEDSEQRLLQVMWELSAAHPEFLSAGVALPPESINWSRESLEVFVATAGFWRPPQRKLPSPQPSKMLDVPLPGSDPPRSAPDFPAPQGTFPRIIWMFWGQGTEGLGLFRRACIQSWICNNPKWRVILLSLSGVSSCFSFIETSDLPDGWQRLRWNVLSDAVRLSLLARHGGVYVDVNVMCTRSLDDWLSLSSSDFSSDLEAFYFPKFGRSEYTNRGEYVENWFLASPKGSELISRWHAAFLSFWNGRTDASHSGGLRASCMFQGIDLNGMREDQTNYLTMHCCFKWLIDSDSFARHRWQTATTLHSADAAIGWIRQLDGVEQNWTETNVACLHAARWLYKNDTCWVTDLLQRAPMIKFVGAHASVFDSQPEQNLMRPGTCMHFLLNQSIGRSACTPSEVQSESMYEIAD